MGFYTKWNKVNVYYLIKQKNFYVIPTQIYIYIFVKNTYFLIKLNY